MQLFKRKIKHVFFFKETSATHFPWKKRRESAKGTGRELGRQLEGNWERERELEKKKSFMLKKRNWKNTAFSITPGKGNWKRELETRAFSTTPGKGNWKNNIFNHAQERELEKPRNCNHA